MIYMPFTLQLKNISSQGRFCVSPRNRGQNYLISRLKQSLLGILAEPVTAPDPKHSSDFLKLLTNATLILFDKSAGNSAWVK